MLLALVAIMMPIGAWAQNSTPTYVASIATDTPAAYAASATIIAQGECGAEGSSVQWTLDDTGTLTIFGRGAMADYSSRSSRPWNDYEDDVTTVVVERGVTHVGDNSFSYFDNLTTVTIADNVSTIGENVFQWCANLSSVKLPDSVTEIGRYAFESCKNLTEITLPMSLSSISSYTFYDCSNLTSVIIPKSVVKIGSRAFRLVQPTESVPLITVHYSGTRAEWNEIDIDSEGNAVLKGGTRHYCTETSWKAATCTTEGQEGGIYCSICKKYVKEPHTLPINPYNHSFEKGFCSHCGAYEEAELKDGYYQISNAGQLFWFANHVNTVDRTASAVLTADIDLEDKPWTPIGITGESSNNFRGHFDGQGHTIRGLNVAGSRNGVGFFGEVRTGTVENFTIYGEVVVNTEFEYVGGVIGSVCGLNGENDLERNGAVIRNITSYVNLTAGAHGIGRIGGFVGYANHQSLIENCAWYGTFDAGKYRVDNGAGGFIGRIQENTSEVTIRNCAAYGSIKTNYAKNSYNNTATIYMGGFLSFSNTNAQTTLENCLFAGKFERGANLTDEARLGAFGTLTSVQSITNCYYLGDDGLAAVHSDSPLKTGDNIEITAVTETQLTSGEVAYLLGNDWGQAIGTDDYPVLGGVAVYHGYLGCTEMVYTNDADVSNEKVHNHVDGFCTACGHIDTQGGVTIRDGQHEAFVVAEDTEVASITYLRTLPNLKWNPLYVPFDIPVADLADDYDVAQISRVYTTTDAEGAVDNMEIEKLTSGTLEANTPYFIRAKSTDAQAMSLTVTGATLKATATASIGYSTDAATYTLIPVYTAMTRTDMVTDIRVITADGVWARMREGSTLKPFRFYLTITPTSSAASAPARVRIVTRGETTSIDNSQLTIDNAASGAVYDLQGRKVTRSTKGIYIVNGRKVMY